MKIFTDAFMSSAVDIIFYLCYLRFKEQAEA